MDDFDPSGNEFNRAINEQIKAATNELLKQPDWGAITTICDSVNQNRQLCEEVSRVVKKRLTTKGPEVALLTLTLLDALMKNCPSFHRYVANPDFMDSLMKLLEKEKQSGLEKFLSKKLTSDEIRARIDIRERTLVMVQAWAHSFSRNEYPVFWSTYERLKQQGVIFPKPDKDEAAPLFTPPVRIPRESAPARTGVEAPFVDPECSVAGDNANLLILTLTETSESEDLKKNDLVQAMISSVRKAHVSITNRIQSGQFGDATTTEDLFRVNDLLLDAIKYYDGLLAGTMERIKFGQTSDTPSEIRRPSGAGDEKEVKKAPGSGAGSSSPFRPSPKPGANEQGGTPRHTKEEPDAPSHDKPKFIPVLSPPPGHSSHKPRRSPSQTALDSVSASSAHPVAPVTQSSGPVVADILDLSSLSSAVPAAVSPSAKKVLSPRSSALSPRRSQISVPIPASRQPVNMLDDVFDPMSSAATPAKAPSNAADEFDPFMDLATRDVKK
jgi:hypothetical protein